MYLLPNKTHNWVECVTIIALQETPKLFEAKLQLHLPPLWTPNITINQIESTNSPLYVNKIIEKTQVNSFCKKLQCSLLNDGFHTNNESASCHETTKCWAHEERGILTGIHSVNNCNNEALIVVLPLVIPSFSMKHWTTNIHVCESEQSWNNENLWAIICIHSSILQLLPST